MFAALLVTTALLDTLPWAASQAEPDRAALEAIYSAAGGPGWKTKTSWMGPGTVCDWWGVQSCDGGRVTDLRLGNNQLSGTLPEALGQMTALTTLYLYNNQLSGTLPEAMGQMTALTSLGLYNNQLSGTLPEAMGQMTALTSLALQSNQLSGTLPEAMGQMTALTELYLYNNDFTGRVDVLFPNKMYYLQLAGNNWTCPLPTDYSWYDAADTTCVAATLPPIAGGLPPVPDTGCLNVLSQVCPNGDAKECEQCVNSLYYVLSRSECTAADYADYCKEEVPCEKALQQFGCAQAGTSADQCYQCAQQNQASLIGSGCDQAIVVSECEKLTEAGDKTKCPAALQQQCDGLQNQGTFCMECVEGSIESLITAGCDFNATQTFCNGSPLDYQCEGVMDKVCGQYFQAGSDCFHCLAANQDALRANCDNSQLTDFCAPRHVPVAPEAPPAACLSRIKAECPDRSDQGNCLRCVSADFESLMSVGCTREEVIGYCQPG